MIADCFRLNNPDSIENCNALESSSGYSAIILFLCYIYIYKMYQIVIRIFSVLIESVLVRGDVSSLSPSGLCYCLSLHFVELQQPYLFNIVRKNKFF